MLFMLPNQSIVLKLSNIVCVRNSKICRYSTTVLTLPLRFGAVLILKYRIYNYYTADLNPLNLCYLMQNLNLAGFPAVYYTYREFSLRVWHLRRGTNLGYKFQFRTPDPI